MHVVTDVSREAGGGVTGWGNDVDVELVGLPDSGVDRARLSASSAVASPSHRAAAAPGSAQHTLGHGPQNCSVFPTGRSTKSPALSVSKHVGASATGKVAQVAVPRNRITISFDEAHQQANISIFHAEQSAYEDSQQRNASSRRQPRTKSPNTGQKGPIFLAPSFTPVRFAPNHCIPRAQLRSEGPRSWRCLRISELVHRDRPSHCIGPVVASSVIAPLYEDIRYISVSLHVDRVNVSKTCLGEQVESSYLPGVVPTITGLKRTEMSPNSVMLRPPLAAPPERSQC